MKKNKLKVLQVKNLKIDYYKNNKEFTALHEISFELSRSEIVCILGESGSGKTSLGKGLIGILPDSAKVKGKVKIFPDIIINLEDKFVRWDKIRAKKIGYIFQDSQQALNPMMKIKEQFKEGLLTHCVVKEKDAEAVSKKYLKYLNFDNPDKVLNSYSFELSGGMCQRVCIALCLCLKPDILIADEITSALDVVNQMEIINLLKRIKEELGLAVIFITHDISLATMVADRVIVINNGIIEEQGKIKEVFKNPKSLYTRKLIQSRKEILNLDIIRDKTNHKKPLLEFKNVYKKYRENKQNTLKNVSFVINENEVVGIFGESGSGKSTLAKCIMGIEKIEEGEIFFDGNRIDTFKKNERREIYRKIQLIFQDARNCLNPRRKAINLLNEPQKYMKLYSNEKARELARCLLQEVNIDTLHFSSTPPQLSTGQCQRLAIARALMVNPTLLICDEAVSALDVNTQLQILHLLLEIKNKYNMALLMISHDIQLLKRFCDRIIFIKEGIICETIIDIKEKNDDFDFTSSHVGTLLQTANNIEEFFTSTIN